MANKTFIPAFKAKVGDWNYYICTMKYAEVARQVAFAFELGGNKDLHTMIQRGISDRTEEITEYLLNSKHRFLGALIVAAWGGSPEYTPIEMNDQEGLLNGIDRGFGVLTFDGTQQYFALDGQHRLRAIKDAIRKDPTIGLEDVCVLLVSHFDTAEGRERTRRLFTNINRNAKSTKAAENIALDEDHGVSILTRRLLEEHEFLSKDGVVIVFTSVGEDGQMTVASNNIPKTHRSALTTITVLNEVLKDLAFGVPASVCAPDIRPTDDDLGQAYGVLSGRIDQLLLYCGSIGDRLKNADSARDVRAPKDREGEGHAFMRPVIQRAIARVLRHLITQGQITWEGAMTELSKLNWEIGKAPWLAVYNPETRSMISGKEFSELLGHLLECHLAPPSRQAIKNTRKQFKELRNLQYPVSEDELAAKLNSETT